MGKRPAQSGSGPGGYGGMGATAPQADATERAVATGSAVEFFHEVDLTDKAAPFVLRQADSEPGAPAAQPPPRLLQSHGWLAGDLVAGTLEEAAARYANGNPATWAEVVPSTSLTFVDRYGRPVAVPSLKVPIERLRTPAAAKPRLSVVFARWGGKHRVGEDYEVEDEGDGGWGGYGCIPSDWYIAGVVEKGLMAHPTIGKAGGGGSSNDFEVLSLFLGSTAQVKRVVQDAPVLRTLAKGDSAATFWMLWPADWEADWNTTGYEGYVERRSLFSSMAACEAAGFRTSFPHPAKLYEHITSKSWMATLSAEQKARLPAGVLVSRKDVNMDAKAAAKNAIAALQDIRAGSVFHAQGGPSAINRSGSGVQKGVCKLGWSWEAKHVWFWTGEQKLAECLRAMVHLPGWLGENCIVQEWVDFDFELRLFFFPPAGWAPPAPLQPLHHEYTAWNTSTTDHSPGAFLKFSEERCLKTWSQDNDALASAKAQAIEAAQFLIGNLMQHHPEPVPMIRMDFMLKRLGPGKAQVVFGEYCEMGACCLKWEDGPPTVWRAALDYAMR
eukprot:TRINITY_DN65309_c0_g1_i1.p1 TRINITY_DN65309_c0_g1~~TRINITY_DN65309_c0_g1_i1.p1  ORF type:complete len:555 (+),score=136.58 TRINITY_DN65309_c0_g1_i1:78-1742(+)